MKIILDLCGGSGAWSAPYAEAGYDVLIVDPVVSGGMDVRLLEKQDISVQGILCAPPCTLFESRCHVEKWTGSARSRYR